MPDENADALDPGYDAARRDAAGEQRDRDAAVRDATSDRQDAAADLRDRAALSRDGGGDIRDGAADRRDDEARARDRSADRRRQLADQRDVDAHHRDRWADATERSGSTGGTPLLRRERSSAELLIRLAQARVDAAADRGHASLDRQAAHDERSSAEVDRAAANRDRESSSTERTFAGTDRAGALDDRDRGAADRRSAGDDRSEGLADRGSAADDRHGALIDELTGTHLRGPGFLELAREMTRSRRLDIPLTMAFVDIDHLKRINDTLGHAAGDGVILRVVSAVRAGLRSYDLMVRYGGDEFFAAVTGVGLPSASRRFEAIARGLSSDRIPVSISVGLTELRTADTAREFVARADAAMYDGRRRRADHGPG